jgi:hypothetical protein
VEESGPSHGLEHAYGRRIEPYDRNPSTTADVILHIGHESAHAIKARAVGRTVLDLMKCSPVSVHITFAGPQLHDRWPLNNLADQCFGGNIPTSLSRIYRR